MIYHLNKFNLILFFILLSSVPAAHASKIFVEKATGSGVSAQELDVATDLVQSQVSDMKSETLVDQMGQADFSLRPKLIRVGSAYILSLSRIQQGSLTHSSQLKAASADELDKVAKRVTLAVLQEGQNQPRVGQITQEEAREGTQRRPTRSNTSFSFGGSYMGDMNTSSIGYSVGVGYSWDVNQARIKVLGEGNFGGGNGFLVSAGLGGNYYLTLTDFAPYVSADFGAGVAKVNGAGIFRGETVGGFVAGLGAGVEILRTSAVSLDLGFRFGILLNSTESGMPKVYALKLGIYF